MCVDPLHAIFEAYHHLVLIQTQGSYLALPTIILSHHHQN